MKKLKIAQIVPPWVSVPPKKYGGIELIASHITKELVKRGHQVTLFASGDSVTKAKLISAFPNALYDIGVPWTNAFYPLFHAAVSFEKLEKFDIIHNHFDYFGLAFSSLIKTPMITTFHSDFTTAEKIPAKYQFLKKFKKNQFVSISNNQRKFKLKLNFIDTVYNGINLNEFEFSDKSQNYLVWLGRITEKKGLIEAIRVAKKTNLPLKIAAKIDKNHLPDIEFYNKKVKPLIDGKQVQYLGEINSRRRNNLLKNALALINPIKWNEPFGLVMPEAMACGTPVIAFNRGSVPEIVKNNKTGFVVPEFDKNKKINIKGLVGAIKKINQIDRKECRKHVEQNFTIEKMVDGYEKVYEKILKMNKKLK